MLLLFESFSDALIKGNELLLAHVHLEVEDVKSVDFQLVELFEVNATRGGKFFVGCVDIVLELRQHEYRSNQKP